MIKVKNENKDIIVYIVISWEMCECETLCNCIGYSIDSVYLSKEDADRRKKEIFQGEVREEKVK